MKRLHTLPTDNVILECLANDTLGRNEDVARFCSILDSFHECTSIALDGAWGSGKTFFVKETKMLLDGFCNNKSLPDEIRDGFKRVLSSDGNKYSHVALSQNHYTVYYDAWVNDNDADPILSLIRAIVGSKQVSMPINNQRDAIKILSSVADCLTGANFSDVSEAIVGDDPLECINQFEYIHKLMEKMIHSAIGKSDTRLVIFIDELDRCKPSFAVSLLERVKHYFTDDRLTFVFSVNQDQLQHTIKSYYGNGMNGSKYLEKLFDISIPLPEASTQRFLIQQGIRDKSYYYDKVFFAVIRYFDLGLRDILKLLQYLKITSYDLAHDRGKFNRTSFDDARDFGLLYVTPILVGLRLHSISEYKSFIDGEFEAPFVEILLLPDICVRHHAYMANSNEFLYNKSIHANTAIPSDKTIIDMRERLSALYHAIFRKNLDDRVALDFGNMHIDKDLKSDLVKLTTPLSEYAVIDR